MLSSFRTSWSRFVLSMPCSFKYPPVQRQGQRLQGLAARKGVKGCLTGFRQDALVNLKQSVQGAFVNVQSGQMRQKVVADKDVDQDKVVDDPLEIVLERERRFQRAELVVEVLAEEREVHKVKVLVLEAVQSKEPQGHRSAAVLCDNSSSGRPAAERTSWPFLSHRVGQT